MLFFQIYIKHWSIGQDNNSYIYCLGSGTVWLVYRAGFIVSQWITNIFIDISFLKRRRKWCVTMRHKFHKLALFWLLRAHNCFRPLPLHFTITCVFIPRNASFTKRSNCQQFAKKARHLKKTDYFTKIAYNFTPFF